MFLLRTAFWIGVVLALLPTFGPKQSAPQAAGVGTTEAVTAASATFADMIQFCNRQPDACAAGAQFASAFGQRAQAGAKMLYEIVGDKARQDGRRRRRRGRPDGKRQVLAEHVDIGRPRAGLARSAPQGQGLALVLLRQEARDLHPSLEEAKGGDRGP